jgi:hypothetical protein
MSQSRQERRAAMRQMMKEMQKSHTLSEARLAANKANAQLSTGPLTSAGKAASSQNNFRHGLYSKQLIIRGENPAELDVLKADLIAEHQPVNITEELLVNEMAEQYWRIKRARRMEANMFAGEDLVIAHMNAVMRLMSNAERGYYKALKTLQQLQKARGFVPQKQEIAVVTQAPAPPKVHAVGGFVPEKTAIGSVEEELALLEAEFTAIERSLKAA